MYVLDVRNVNEALDEIRNSACGNALGDYRHRWIERSSRNGRVIELDAPCATVYRNPWERVSFSSARDANPFFHFFESIWIMAGREDVEFLSLFNKKMIDYSDDGVRFHAPYGYRLRLQSIDQIQICARMLKDDKNTRRAVMSIWDPRMDLGTVSRDIPCNDIVFFKGRQDEYGNWTLDMTVCCRSNDVIWGAYGANAVQFSVIQELIALASGMQIGQYTQISDSLHIYVENDAWQRMLKGHDWRADRYFNGEVSAHPLMRESPLDEWLAQAESLCEDILAEPELDESHYEDSFFRNVAFPMWKAWWTYRNRSMSHAVDFLETQDLRIDWLAAAMSWLLRRAQK